MTSPGGFYRLTQGHKENKMWPNGYFFRGKEREKKNPHRSELLQNQKARLKKRIQTNVPIMHTTVHQNSEIK